MDGLKAQAPFPRADIEGVLDATAGLWPGLRGARLFFTGATGFFGSWLLESLVAANRRFDLKIEATVLSRDPPGFARRVPHLGSARGVRWVQGSAVDFRVEPVAQALHVAADRLTFDALIHLATEADNERTIADPAGATAVIAGSTRRALEFATRVGARRFLFTSSGSIYGLQPSSLPFLAEDSPSALKPEDNSSAYAISGRAKQAAEQLCVAATASGHLEAVIARCFTFSGPGLPLEGKFALGNFLTDALAGRDIVVKGDGTPVRSYLYAADLAVWLWTLLVRGAPGRAYNVGSEDAVTIGQAAGAVQRAVAPDAQVRVVAVPNPARPSHRLVPSTARARLELGLRETIDLSEGIRRTAAWCRA